VILLGLAEANDSSVIIGIYMFRMEELARMLPMSDDIGSSNTFVQRRLSRKW
tara:strand:+ start:200 stop:355 length:156 start_codon:yes stop_codon:yes gene_type:complete